MQNRMKTHPLSQEQIQALLEKSPTGALSTLGPDGAPYAVPVHFAVLDGALYFHGLPAGQKLDNLKADRRVCLTVWEMEGLLLDRSGTPCDTNTAYESVVVQGTAALVEEPEDKARALNAIVGKYTPHLAGQALPENMVRGTAVVKITPTAITGKYYR